MSYLKKLQQTEIEILDEIDRICKENSLEYFLSAGTLLGAVRHKGFIPWDDDIDVMMKRADYEKFCEVCISGLKDGFYIHSQKTDKNYWLPFVKIRKKNTVFEETSTSSLSVPKEIFVDVFPLDEVKSESSATDRLRFEKIRTQSRAILDKLGINKGKKVGFRVKLRRIFLGGLSVSELSEKQQKLMKKNNNKGYGYYINFAGVYKYGKEIFPKEVIGRPVNVIFENKKYPAPQNYTVYLEKMYGDYMTLPPEEKRTTHKPIRISFNTAGPDEDLSEE